MEALLDEPLVGQVVGLPHPAEHRVGRDADVGQHELRVAVGEGVGVVGVVGQLEARGAVVNEEQRREALAVAQHVAVEDHEVGVGRAGHEPLLAVEHPLAGGGVEDGGRRERPGVRALARLRDRVRAVALAAEARVQVAGALLRRAVDERVVGPGDERPQAAGRLAQLLVDDDLLDRGPALAASAAWQAAAVEPEVDGDPLQLLGRRVVEASVALELRLERLEVVDDVGSGAIAELGLGRGGREVHGGESGEGRGPLTRESRGPGRGGPGPASVRSPPAARPTQPHRFLMTVASSTGAVVGVQAPKSRPTRRRTDGVARPSG